MNKTISKNRFKTLGKALDSVGINIEYQIDWGSSNPVINPELVLVRIME
jgi:hypothetical protein